MIFGHLTDDIAVAVASASDAVQAKAHHMTQQDLAIALVGLIALSIAWSVSHVFRGRK